MRRFWVAPVAVLWLGLVALVAGQWWDWAVAYLTSCTDAGCPALPGALYWLTPVLVLGTVLFGFALRRGGRSVAGPALLGAVAAGVAVALRTHVPGSAGDESAARAGAGLLMAVVAVFAGLLLFGIGTALAGTAREPGG
jgi:hypothetical protein